MDTSYEDIGRIPKTAAFVSPLAVWVILFTPKADRFARLGNFDSALYNRGASCQPERIRTMALRTTSAS